MKSPRAVPPEDISAGEFFTRWVPAMVADDEERRSKLMGTTASIEFTLTEPRRQIFTVYIDEGAVLGAHGPHHDPDLRVELDDEGRITRMREWPLEQVVGVDSSYAHGAGQGEGE
jgi:hypothetical protein